MSGLHNTQTFPSARRWADLFKSANVPGARNSCGGADAAAVVLRHRLEALASQFAELEAFRERVHQAERKIEPRYTQRNAMIREACSAKVRARVGTCTINRRLRRADKANFALPEHVID
jgi:hypothetical protein